MPRGKKNDEEQDLLLQDPEDEIDPEEASLAAEKRKALHEEKIIQSRKRKAKAAQELKAIEEGDEADIPTQSGQASYYGKFGDTLRENDAWTVFVSRRAPKRLNGKDLPQNIAQYDTPIDMEELKMEIESTHGGGTYRLMLKDDDFRIRGRRQITIMGDPKPPSDWDEDEENPLLLTGGRGRNGFADEEEDDEFDEEQKLKKDIRVAELNKRLARVTGMEEEKEDVDDKIERALARQQDAHEKQMTELRQQGEMQGLRDQLADLSKKLEEGPARRGGGDDDAVQQLKDQMAEQNRQHAEALSKMDRDRQASEHKASMDAMNARLETLQNGTQASSADANTAMMLEFIKTNGTKNEAQTNAMVTMMKESIGSSVNQYQSVVDKLLTQKDPGSKTTELKELAETMMSIGGVLGMGGGSEEPKDFGTALLGAVEKVVPEVLNEIREGRQAVQGSTQEQMMKLAGRMTEEIKGEVRAQMSGRSPAAAPPPGAPGVPTGPRPVAPPSHSEPVSGPPTAMPQGGPVAPPSHSEPIGSPPGGQPVAQPNQGPLAGRPSLEDERRQRVNVTLEYLGRDLELLPGEATWTHAAWSVLPGDIRKKIIMAQSDEDVYEAIKDEGDIAKLEAVWSYIKEEGDHRKFLINSINQIKTWARQGGPPNAAAGVGGSTPTT